MVSGPGASRRQAKGGWEVTPPQLIRSGHLVINARYLDPRTGVLDPARVPRDRLKIALHGAAAARVREAIRKHLVVLSGKHY